MGLDELFEFAWMGICDQLVIDNMGLLITLVSLPPPIASLRTFSDERVFFNPDWANEQLRRLLDSYRAAARKRQNPRTFVRDLLSGTYGTRIRTRDLVITN